MAVRKYASSSGVPGALIKVPEPVIRLNPEGRVIGIIEEVMVNPGQDILVVQGEAGEVLIPFRKEICIEVNRETGRVVADMPEGLEEINR